MQVEHFKSQNAKSEMYQRTRIPYHETLYHEQNYWKHCIELTSGCCVYSFICWKETDRGREIVHLLISPQVPVTAKTEAGPSQIAKNSCGAPMWVEGLQDRMHCIFLPRVHISRKLDQKPSSKNSNRVFWCMFSLGAHPHDILLCISIANIPKSGTVWQTISLWSQMFWGKDAQPVHTWWNFSF